MDYFDYHQMGANDAARAPHHDKQPMPSREELLARNSFGSVNDNKWLNRDIAKRKELRQFERNKTKAVRECKKLFANSDKNAVNSVIKLIKQEKSE